MWEAHGLSNASSLFSLRSRLADSSNSVNRRLILNLWPLKGYFKANLYGEIS